MRGGAKISLYFDLKSSSAIKYIHCFYIFSDSNYEYICFAIQYIKIQLQNVPNFDAKLAYRLETGRTKKKI